MADMSNLVGLDEVITNLEKQFKMHEQGCERGLVRAGLLIQRDAQKRVPVEYGELKRHIGSNKVSGNGFFTIVRIDSLALYSLWVHEMINPKTMGMGVERPSGLGVFWGPHGQPKFLENAAQSNKVEAVAIVRAAMLGASFDTKINTPGGNLNISGEMI
jgi:hypothetical protein